MSLDLNFWKEIDEIEGVEMSYREIYERLSNEEVIEGLEELPIPKILEKLQQHFSDWEISEQIYFEKDNMAFDINYTSQFVRFDCYSVPGTIMNDIIDIMISFKCPLYDSAIDERFEIF